MTDRKVEPLDKDCRFVVSEVITDPVTEENGFVLVPMGKHPTRQIGVGDIFQRTGYDPKEGE
jgi:hypothetical protein